ncbi:MAG: purine nucleoside permease [Aphanocapsa sp. GSE-SYN-MK-11-07L]|nr:purine nucleoside permease [Aphanocapsa sp. GSE-SYN-MK-11-07L]
MIKSICLSITALVVGLAIAGPAVRSQPVTPTPEAAPTSPDVPPPSPPAPTNTKILPASDYGIDNPILQRAMNLARQAAERTNGGLSKYRAQASMYGPATQSPFVDNGNGTWTFTFFGGAPGFTTPSLESVVTIAKDGSQVTVDYNGPIRDPAKVPSASTPANPGSSSAAGIPLRRAMNLARQTAERANGGLSAYRAEAAMYGSTDTAPIKDNGNDTWTFSFRGGTPGFTTPTIESVVTVSKAGQVTLDYNGPIRQASEQPLNNQLPSSPEQPPASPTPVPTSPTTSTSEQPQPQGQQQ